MTPGYPAFEKVKPLSQPIVKKFMRSQRLLFIPGLV